MQSILLNENNYDQVDSFYVTWHARKRKSVNTDYKILKVEGYFTEQKNLFVAACMPVLTTKNRDLLVASSVLCFTTVHLMDLKFKEICKR
jgi:hypothetical protein